MILRRSPSMRSTKCWLSSALGSGIGNPFPQDLTRYDQFGARTYSTGAAQAYFSIDGPTQLVRFNQSAGGDYGDWFGGTPRVQDAFGTPGSTPNLGVETVALDVIGFDPIPVTPNGVWDGGG